MHDEGEKPKKQQKEKIKSDRREIEKSTPFNE